MNSDQIMSDILEMKKRFNEPRPIAIVCSKFIEKELIKEGFDKKQSDPISFFSGIDIFSFDDVSDNGSILFWDKRKLATYFLMREKGKGHSEAMYEVFGNVDEYNYLELPENIHNELSEYNSMMKDIHVDMSRIMGVSDEFLDIDDV